MLSAGPFNLQQAGARGIEASKEPEGRPSAALRTSRRYDRGRKGLGARRLNPHPLQRGKTQRMRHPQNRSAARLRADVRGKVEATHKAPEGHTPVGSKRQKSRLFARDSG
jgi:hypothetical protein